MIESTFLHLPGVGPATESRLWSVGLRCWEDLWTALQAGRLPRDLLRGGRQGQLFPLDDGPTDDKAIRWMDALDQSRTALRQKEFRYFLELLSPAEHWRLLESLVNDALYLDIETTGLSADLHYVTVVGALYDGIFHQWTWPEPLDQLAEWIGSAPLTVTFNGRRFDVPFLRRHFPTIPQPSAHIDLLYIARGAGLPGGQKAIEEQLGLQREDAVRGVDGPEAVACWCKALYGDGPSYRQLLAYNRADVELMPQIASHLCGMLRGKVPPSLAPPTVSLSLTSTSGRRAAPFSALQRSWKERRPGLHQLQPRHVARFGRPPVVVGIDLRAKAARPTGWARCEGSRVETCIVHDDAEILDVTLAAQPDLVSIDAPLFLPRGRRSVSDDSPCRKDGGIVRDAERILWARGIRVYPALIKQMQGLTRRGIDLTRQFESHGIRVIESYPGAAQDILNIPRKKLDEDLLRRGLSQFGYRLRGAMTHDELDAVTSALVGQYYLADTYEAIGADDEGYMIIPRSSMLAGPAAQKRVVSLVGLPGAGKTTVTRALAQRLGWRSFLLGDVLRTRAQQDTALGDALAQGDMAPEPLVSNLVREAVTETTEPGLIIDGFPRHREQVAFAEEVFDRWSVLVLDAAPSVAFHRLAARISCRECGFPTSRATQKDSTCPGCGNVDCQVREEDQAGTAWDRLRESNRRLKGMLQRLENVEVHCIDASCRPGVVADKAVRELMATRLGPGRMRRSTLMRGH